jgi:beta-phosphoglucomutase
MTSKYFSAILFDLDGVLTDTAEYHYLAWKTLADELGISFTRDDNENLRGVPRQASLDFILGLDNRTITEDEAQALMDRKNSLYRSMLEKVTSADLLPGVSDLLGELKESGIKIAVASASRNAPDVIERLGIGAQIDALSHGSSVERQKPYPDLFLHAAKNLGVAPARCIVIEDAAAGIQAAHAAGMSAVGLGPVERVGVADLVLSDLKGATVEKLSRATLWRVSEEQFAAEKQHHHETIFTIGNGYLGTRGSLEERHSGDMQATLIHGIYDARPITFTELANAPDWTALEIWINGQRFSMNTGRVSDYARWLDLRMGTLNRRLVWTLAEGTPPVEIIFTRFANLADEHSLNLRVKVTPLQGDISVRVRAKLDAHVENVGVLHWDTTQESSTAEQADLLVRTRASQKTVAMSTRLMVSGVDAALSPSDCSGCPGIEAEASLQAGESATFDKFVSVFTSRDTDDPVGQADVHIREASRKGFDALLLNQKNAWDEFWAVSDVVIEGDNEAQLSIRHGLFQLRIAAPTNDKWASIPAKTLSGFAYAGHVFWDNEIFVLPFFTYTQPELARNMLMYRWHTLPGARKKAAGNGYAGAQFAWESAETGEEVTPTWVPHFSDRTKLVRIWTGDIQLHITADVAYAMHQYWQATGDDEFWHTVGILLLLETAVFWGERVEAEGDVFSIRDVIGCDEYHDHVDNNAFTNSMARWHLKMALDALDWLESNDATSHADLVEKLDLSPERLAHWRDVIEKIVVLHDVETGLIEQFEGFFDLKPVDWEAYADRTESMQVLLGIEGANEHQVLKQADVVALLALLGDQFDEKTWRVNWDYYVPITDHTYGSSLGPAMHAWVACRMNEPEKAYEHFMRAARADLANIRGNAGEGIHAASAGGMWEAAVFGFAGLQFEHGEITLSPQLPAHWKSLSFKIRYREKHYEIVAKNVEEVRIREIS